MLTQEVYHLLPQINLKINGLELWVLGHFCYICIVIINHLNISIMNNEAFLKTVGKKFTHISNGTYEFQAPVVSCMVEVEAWHNLRKASVFERDGYRFYLVYALNGTYFKYDGPGSEERCVNLFVEDIKTGDCWLHGCIIMRDIKSAKRSIRMYRDIALKAPIAEIEIRRKQEHDMYSHRYMTNKVTK